jgi:methylmalonyl-CoA/ethylmalonyl-CoA epimerase
MKIHHIGYAVNNIEDSLNEFKKLGYKCVENKIVDKKRKVIIQFIKNGDYLIELVAPLGKESPVTNLLKKQGNSPYHICYETDNLEKEIKDLDDDGFVIISDLLKAPAIYNKKVIFLYKKEIGLIELVEE